MAQQKAQQAAQQKAQELAQQKAQQLAQQKAQELAQQKAQQAAQQKAAQLAQQKAQEMAQQKAQQAAQQKAQELAQQKAQQAAQQKATQIAQQKAQEMAQQKAQQAAQQKAQELAQQRARQKAQELAQQKAQQAAQQKAKELAQQTAGQSAQQKAQQAAEQKAQQMAQQKAQQAAQKQRIVALQQEQQKAVQGRVEKLKPEQRAQFDKLQKSVAQKQTALRKPEAVGPKTTLAKGKPQSSTVKPSVSKSALAQAVQAKAQNDPKLQTAVDKLTGRNSQPLKKADLAALNKNLPPGQAARMSLTQAQFTTVAQMANNASDPRLKDAMTRYLQYGPAGMSPQDIALIQADLAQSAKFPGQANRVGALGAVLAETRDYQNSQQALLALQNQNSGGGKGGNFVSGFLGTAGGALVGTLLSGGGVLGEYQGGGGFFPGGNGYYPPEVPTLFYPSDPNDVIDPDDAFPSVPGVCLAITNPPYTLAAEGSDRGQIQLASSDQAAGYAELADFAYDAAPWQTTRYLRVGNATREKVVVSVRFLVETGPETTVWLPADPNDTGDDWAVMELEPGESADLKQDDWQVNARQVCIWARSDSSQWNQFRSRPLDLVSDQQYQSAAPQVFNYTVN
jgi:hypothetical protein